MPGLSVQNVSRFFGAITALDSISIQCPENSITAIIGPSGSGKTTLLRVLAGLDSPDHGTVLIENRPFSLGDTALCFQDSPLYPHLNVWDNVAFPLRLKAVRASKSQIKQRVTEVLTMLKIDHLAERKIEELSGGQKQRVGIARSLVRDVDIYLFDEPMAHLDETLARGILEDLRHIQRTLKLTFLYVTHSKEEAFALADQLIIMKNGTIAQAGSPEELVKNPDSLFVAEFLSPTQLNVERSEGLVSAFRPEDTQLIPGGTAIVESLTYLGGNWLVHTTHGRAVSDSPPQVGAAVTLKPQKVYRF